MALLTAPDLRRMFEDKNTAVRAEKLSHILEALEKLKVTANSRYESAFSQVCIGRPSLRAFHK